MKITKRDGKKEDFQEEKIKRTCVFSGASVELARKIAVEVKKEVNDKTTTIDIRNLVFEKLKMEDPKIANEYLALFRRSI